MSTDFIQEYSSFLMESESQTLPIIYAGDFNIWFDNSSNLETRKFADTFNIFGLRNHVMESMHGCRSHVTPDHHQRKIIVVEQRISISTLYDY